MHNLAPSLVVVVIIATAASGLAGLETSLDGSCGNGTSCMGSMFGSCCSKQGYCGSTTDYCGGGCQIAYGFCDKSKQNISPDGSCGGAIGFTCQGSNYGSCCSQYGYCGNSTQYCGASCQSKFGSCFRSLSPPSNLSLYAYSSSSIGYSSISMVTPKRRAQSGSATPPAETFPVSTTSLLTATSSSPCSATSSPTGSCIPCQGQGGKLPFCGSNINTNHYNFTPKTCRTVYYEFNVTNTTIAPDGISRIALLINGQMPGPTIEANWGDTIVVRVNNRLQSNGTSLHFHGARQLNNNEFDGVPSITQCPIAPGKSMTYTWTVTNYGTSWYHSHFALQTWMGLYGPVIIHGPSVKQYDVDAGTVMLQDWSHKSVDSMFMPAEDAITGGPRIMDNGLINGLNTWGVDGTMNQTGKRFEFDTRFEHNKTYLFRVVNVAIQSTYKFSIDGHTLEVINMDFTPIVPYKTKVLNINIGQRYMVVVRADATPGPYWLRADNQNGCAITKQALDIKAIIRYSNAPPATIPTSAAYNYTPGCIDEPASSLVPLLPLNATDVTAGLNFEFNVTAGLNEDKLFRWYLSNTTFDSTFHDPTLLGFLANGSAPTYSGDLILDVPNFGDWVYVVMESEIPLPHPIHLHGHDFFVLAAGEGLYEHSSTSLQLMNPPRRDTALLPAKGHLVVAFQADNPGAWLMHCHVGWHVSMGFALQILEGKSKIRDVVQDEGQLQETCKSWNNWANDTRFVQFDSGV